MQAKVKIFEVARVDGRSQVTKTVEVRDTQGRDREDLKAKAVRRAGELGLAVRACSWTAAAIPELVLYGTRDSAVAPSIPGWRHRTPPQ